MTCSNWILTVLAVVIFMFAMWPETIGMTASKWVIGIAAIVILIVAWTGVDCKYCQNTSEKEITKTEPKPTKKTTKKKKK